MMNFKFQVLLAFLKLGLSMANPNPETAVNINVDVKGSGSNNADNQAEESSVYDQLKDTGSSDFSSFSAGLLEVPLPSDFSPCKTGITSGEFVIQVFRDGLWEGYVTPQDENGNEYYVVTDSHTSASVATFEPVDGIWGYIKFVSSNKVMRPDGNGVGHFIWASHDKGRWSQFAIDQVTHQIIHRSGHDSGQALTVSEDFHLNNGRGTYLETHLVRTCGSDKQVLAYGDATVDVKWELIFSVDYPLASQTYVVHSTVGKSSSQSTDTNFKFAWEFTVSARYWFLEFSVTAGVEYEISKSSTQTWYSQIEETDTYHVVVGEPVAVWQKVFYGQQIGNRAVFDSNVFCHTNSSDTHPNEVEACKYNGP